MFDDELGTATASAYQYFADNKEWLIESMSDIAQSEWPGKLRRHKPLSTTETSALRAANDAYSTLTRQMLTIAQNPTYDKLVWNLVEPRIVSLLFVQTSAQALSLQAFVATGVGDRDVAFGAALASRTPSCQPRFCSASQASMPPFSLRTRSKPNCLRMAHARALRPPILQWTITS